LTTAYFIFSILHCIIQASFQIRAFTINAEAASFLYSISVAGNATDLRIPALGDGDLRLCANAPVNPKDLSGCDVIWNGLAKNNSIGTNAAAQQTSDEYPETSTFATTSSSEIVAPTAAVPAITPVVSTSTTPVVAPSTVTVVLNAGSTSASSGTVLSSVDEDDDEDDEDEDEADDLEDEKSLDSLVGTFLFSQDHSSESHHADFGPPIWVQDSCRCGR
jgi:hypothetical protein